MEPTQFELTLAIIMVAWAVALGLWFRKDITAASLRRMMQMMTRVGLDPEIVTGGGPRTHAVMKAARRRCRNCRAEDLCERWLAGKTGGGNYFCPNAHTFRILTGAQGRAA